MATSVTMPMIMVSPIIAVMFSSVPVIQRPKKTANTANRGCRMMANTTRKRS